MVSERNWRRCWGTLSVTSPTDFAPVKQVQMARFTGERWDLFGELITGAVT